MTREDLDGEGTALVQHDPARVEEGVIEPLAEATVPVTDRGFLYGDAVFETLRCYAGEPAFVERHADRLAAGLDRLGIPFEPADHDPAGWLGAVAARLLPSLEHAGDGSRDAYLRVSVTRGRQDGLLTPTETVPTVVAIARPLATRQYDPADVVTTDIRRPAAAAELKTHNYLASVLARADAPGADETLLRGVDGEGYVSGAASNLVARVDGRWRAPTASARAGVTREVVAGLLDDEGVAVEDRGVDDTDAVAAAFLTNSTWGVRPVASLDGRSLGIPDRVTRLRDRYLERASSTGTGRA